MIQEGGSGIQQRQHFQFNKQGRRFVNGKALDEDLRELIVLSLLKQGADGVTGKVPYGKIKQTAERCSNPLEKISRRSEP